MRRTIFVTMKTPVALILGGLLSAGAAQATSFGDFMNPSKWFGKNNRDYGDYDYGRYGGPGYGYGGPGYGYGGPGYGYGGYGYGAPGYGYGAPGYGYGGYGYGAPGYGYGAPGYGYGAPGYGAPGYGYGAPAAAAPPAGQP